MKHDLERLAAIKKELAERSLAQFTRQAWPVTQTVGYQHNWHIDVIAEHLEAAARQEIQGVLCINIPFRCMKSLLVSVFFPAWLWCQNPQRYNKDNLLPLIPGTWMGPGAKILTVSHRETIAKRDALATRRILSSPWYQANWGSLVSFSPDQNEKFRYENTRSGLRVALARGGELGEGGDIIIADDLINRQQAHSEGVREDANEYWGQTLRSRYTDPSRSVFICIMQRLHQRDTTGYILETEPNVTHVMLPMEFEPERKCYSPIKVSTAGDAPAQEMRYLRSKQVWLREGTNDVPDPMKREWETSETQVVYPCDPRTDDGDLLWEERFSPEAIESQKTVLSSYGAAGQLQQRPAPREGGMFKRSWFEYIDAIPLGTVFVRHWDLAASVATAKNPTPAWTAGLKLGRSPDGTFIIADIRRVRDEGYEVRRLISSVATSDGYGVAISLPQDPGQAGKVQAKDFVRMLAGWRVHVESETGDKVTRAEPVAAQAEAGNVKIMRGPWNEAFFDEATTFPNGAYKDQVDALSGAFGRLTFSRPSETRTSVLVGLI